MLSAPDASPLAALLRIPAILAAALVASYVLRLNFAGPTSAFYAARLGAEAKLIPAGAFSSDGLQLFCSRYPTVVTNGFADYGAAFFGFILINPDRFATMPVALRRFAYAHECGHQYVGYSEIGADCYAVKRGLREGWFGEAALGEVCGFLEKSKGSAFHLPGKLRCAAITACYEQAQGRK
jgi:hypothetical protein